MAFACPFHSLKFGQAMLPVSNDKSAAQLLGRYHGGHRGQ